MKFAKVMFLHLSVSHSVHRGGVGGGGGGGMCGGGHAWQGGIHGSGGHVWQGHAWQGVYMGGMYGGGACVVGACGRGACMAGGKGACVAGGVHGTWPCMPPLTLQDMVGQCTGSTHPTGMHSSSRINLICYKFFNFVRIVLERRNFV